MPEHLLWAKHRFKFLKHRNWTKYYCFPILKMRKLRHRAVKWLVQVTEPHGTHCGCYLWSSWSSVVCYFLQLRLIWSDHLDYLNDSRSQLNTGWTVDSGLCWLIPMSQKVSEGQEVDQRNVTYSYNAHRNPIWENEVFVSNGAGTLLAEAWSGSICRPHILEECSSRMGTPTPPTRARFEKEDGAFSKFHLGLSLCSDSGHRYGQVRYSCEHITC